MPRPHRPLLLLLGLALLACGEARRPGGAASTAAAVTSTAAPAPVATAAPPAPPAGPTRPPGRWLAGDLHVHTTWSRDARAQGGDDVATTLRLVESAGLDFVVLTDHNNRHHRTDPAFVSSSLVLLSGEEWGSTSHTGAIGGVNELPPFDDSRPPSTWNGQVAAAFAQAHAEGGAVVLNHPCGVLGPDFWWFDAPGFDAVEVWNGSWSFLKEVRLLRPAIEVVRWRTGMLQAGLDVSPELRAALQARGGLNDMALRFWEAHLDRGRRVAAVGGSDRHMIVLPGRPTTWVFAGGATPAAIVSGVRAARTVVTARPDGPFVELRADGDGDGIFEALVGDEVPASRTVAFEAEVTGAAGGRAIVVKDGRPLLEVRLASAREVVTFFDLAGGPAWYRVDLLLPVSTTLPFTPPTSVGPHLTHALHALQAAALSAGHLSPVHTHLPTVVPPDPMQRVLDRLIHDPGWARAAITSPIYAR